MVLIISSKRDHSTSEVIRWLRHFRKPFLRLNEEDKVILESLTYNNFTFQFEGKTYSLNDFDSVWYRRGNFNLDIFPVDVDEESSIIDMYGKTESEEVQNFIHNLLNKKRSINNRNHHHVNKLDVLSYCESNGLINFPFLVTQSKQEIVSFVQDNGHPIISKALRIPFIYYTSENTFASYSHRINDEEIMSLPERFTPTFFQKYIPKKYEIRTFFFDSSFFSMAIFSQKNAQTEIDFRKYDHKKPNRKAPFKLPRWYEEKVLGLMEHFKLDCASFDTIICKEGSYNLIDVNPIGQFGMVSYPCNYSLEKKIANYL